MNAISRTLVLPLISAGILGGAIGFAGSASADVTTYETNGSHSIVVTPNMTANHGNNNNGMGNWHQRRADRRAQMGW